MARIPFFSESSLSSPPAVRAMRATARVVNGLSRSRTDVLNTPSSKGGQSFTGMNPEMDGPNSMPAKR